MYEKVFDFMKNVCIIDQAIQDLERMIAVVNYESKTVFWKDSQKPMNNMF